MSFAERHQLEEFTPKEHALVWVISLGGIVFFAVLYFLFRDVNVWESFQAAGGLKNPSYSERIYESSIFRTRANTWSNYAFVIVGIYALVFTWLDIRISRPASAGFIVQNPLFGALFGIGCVYLGIGSGIFHASLTRWGQQLDVASMYAAMLALIAMNCYRLIPRVPGTQLRTDYFFAVLAIIGSYLLYHYKWQMSSGVVLPTLILTLGFLATCDLFRRTSQFAKLWMVGSFVSLVLAVICRQTDVAGKFSGPDTIFQGHAFWHVFCALTLGCIYMYYRSEKIVKSEAA